MEEYGIDIRNNNSVPRKSCCSGDCSSKMITVDTRPGAIVLLVFALILLGTWVGLHALVQVVITILLLASATADACSVIVQGPLLNLAERRGRHTVHTYMVIHQHALPIDALLHDSLCSVPPTLSVHHAAYTSHTCSLSK